MIKMTLLYHLPIALRSFRKRVYIDHRLIQLGIGIIDNRGSLAARLVPLVRLGDRQRPCNVQMFTELSHVFIDMRPS
jgi:hypothetical protein